MSDSKSSFTSTLSLGTLILFQGVELRSLRDGKVLSTNNTDAHIDVTGDDTRDGNNPKSCKFFGKKREQPGVLSGVFSLFRRGL